MNTIHWTSINSFLHRFKIISILSYCSTSSIIIINYKSISSYMSTIPTTYTSTFINPNCFFSAAFPDSMFSLWGRFWTRSWIWRSRGISRRPPISLLTPMEYTGSSWRRFRRLRASPATQINKTSWSLCILSVYFRRGNVSHCRRGLMYTPNKS